MGTGSAPGTISRFHQSQCPPRMQVKSARGIRPPHTTIRPARIKPDQLRLEAADKNDLEDFKSAILRTRRFAILKWAMFALKRYQDENQPKNHFHRILKLTRKFPNETCKQRAVRLCDLTGVILTHAAFRQQLVRARREFARFLVNEVARRQRRPTRERIEEKLIEIDLYRYIRRTLGTKWYPEDDAPDVT